MKHDETHHGLIVFGFVEPEIMTEFIERLRFPFPTLSSGERAKKPLGILSRSQEVGGLDDAAQFRDRDQRHISAFAPMNDDRFSRINRLVEQRFQVCLGVRVGSFSCHSGAYRLCSG